MIKTATGSELSVVEEDIRQALDEIKDPCSVAASVPMGLNEMGIVKAINVIPGGHVEIELRLTSPFCEMIAYFKNEAIAKVTEVNGVTSVYIKHDSGLDWTPDMIAPEAQARRKLRLEKLYNLSAPSLDTKSAPTQGR